MDQKSGMWLPGRTHIDSADIPILLGSLIGCLGLPTIATCICSPPGQHQNEQYACTMAFHRTACMYRHHTTPHSSRLKTYHSLRTLTERDWEHLGAWLPRYVRFGSRTRKRQRRPLRQNLPGEVRVISWLAYPAVATQQRHQWYGLADSEARSLYRAWPANPLHTC